MKPAERLLTYRVVFETLSKEISDSKIVEVAQILLERNRSDGYIYVIGNGGSATTASHFSVDLGVGSCRRGVKLRAISLVDNSGSLTATGNDTSFDLIYSNQLEHLASKRDTLIIISASGNSMNLLSAARKAIQLGMYTISMTGFDGGALKNLTDTNFHVNSPIGEYGVVEDLHLSICHRITDVIRILGGAKCY
jgi:D-sedoheptulose 7-phosphate isomerase